MIEKETLNFKDKPPQKPQKVTKSFIFPPERLFVFLKTSLQKKKLKLHMGGWTATEEAVTDSDCAGDGRQQQSLYYRFFN